jgi:hypothetical protein
MLVIRSVQMKALEDALLNQWICRYLGSCYSEQVQAWKPGLLAAFVERCMNDAQRRGFRQGRDLRKYIHVAFILGEDFPENPRFPWARRILDDPNFQLPGSRLRALEDATLRHLGSAPERAQKATAT